MSPHGIPDWGLVGPKYTTYGLDDLGEHAVRLNSPHHFDRRGDCLHLTDFREGIGPWAIESVGGGGTVGLVTEHGRQGAYAVRLRSGREIGEQAVMTLVVPFPVLSLCGLEYSFSKDLDSEYWEAELSWYDGTWSGVACIRYNVWLSELQYENPIGTFNTLGDDIDMQASDRCENTIKMVVDLSYTATRPQEFVRVILNNETRNLAGIPVVRTIVGLNPHLTCTIRHGGLVASTPDGYVDNVIVTQNEPNWQ